MTTDDEGDALRHACVELARTRIRFGAPIDLAMIRAIVDEFYKIAAAEIVDSPNVDRALLARAVTYINRVHSIPLEADEISWFTHTLRALIEVARPNVIVGDDGTHFLKEMRAGIDEALDNR
jgi:hypothetical protein